MLAIWSLLPLPFLNPAWTWKLLVHVQLKPSLENFEHYFASMWDECNYAVVWTFFGIAFLWDWNENRPFPVLWPLPSFPNFLTNVNKSVKEISLEYSLDAEVETLVLCPPDVKNWLIWKDPDAGKDWRQEKGTTEDEMVGWHTDSMDMSLSRLQELVIDREPGVLQFMGSQRVRHDWTTELNVSN